MPDTPEIFEPNDLLSRYNALKADNPMVRARDAAAQLGASEGELVAARCGAEVIRLKGPFKELIAALPELGRVMVLTRNETVVHERKGVFGNISLDGHVGVVLNETVDLRLFLKFWVHGFAVEETVRSGTRRSLQFFDRAGMAVHKVYLLEESDAVRFDGLIAAHRDADQSPGIAVKPYGEAKPGATASEVDLDAFRAGWAGLQDVHDFHGLLRKHRLDRLQALRLAEERFAAVLPVTALRSALEKAAAREVPIMVFAGNRGCIQIHSGPVSNIRPMENWENVLDPDFNLHVRSDRLMTAYAVRKPTVDGIVTALEFYDNDGVHVAQLFGVRKPGQPESPDWRRLVEDVEAERDEVPA
ncbi:hemin-degrading factor [Pacificispira sp.]|uniref:hemin-degrading factor n=1 Tax=Pacificispira sp. TaxID=2888761 RepID=UPI003BABB5B3